MRSCINIDGFFSGLDMRGGGFSKKANLCGLLFMLQSSCIVHTVSTIYYAIPVWG